MCHSCASRNPCCIVPATVFPCGNRAPGNMDSCCVLDSPFRGNDNEGPLSRLRFALEPASRRPGKRRGMQTGRLRYGGPPHPAWPSALPPARPASRRPRKRRVASFGESVAFILPCFCGEESLGLFSQQGTFIHTGGLGPVASGRRVRPGSVRQPARSKTQPPNRRPKAPDARRTPPDGR